jgi:hypothetical protein
LIEQKGNYGNLKDSMKDTALENTNSDILEKLDLDINKIMMSKKCANFNGS